MDEVFSPKWCKTSFQVPDPKVKVLYDLIIFLNLAYDSAQNEIFFVKIKIRVLNLWLDETFGPKLQKNQFLGTIPQMLQF